MKFVILIVAAGLLYLLFKGDQKKKDLDKSASSEKLKETGELVKDPMCGSFVAADGGIRVREGDKVHVFCSYECRDKFLKQMGASPKGAKSESSDSDGGAESKASEPEGPETE